MPVYYSLAIALGLALLTLSFLLPEPSVATIARILAVVAFLLAVVFCLLGGLA